MNIRAGSVVAGLTVGMLMAGCAWWPKKTTVPAPTVVAGQKEQPAPEPKKNVRPAIYVRPFAFHTAQIHSDRKGKDLQELKQDVTKALRDRVQDRLREIGKVERPPIGLPATGWLVDGELLEVVDREMLRYAMGFDRTGVGLAARVRLYDLAVSSTVPMTTWDIPSASERLSADRTARVISICDMARALRERLGSEMCPNP